jgi:hypothetical protein
MQALFNFHNFTTNNAADWTDVRPSNWLRELLREMETDGLLTSYWDWNTRGKLTQFWAVSHRGKRLAAATEDRIKWLTSNMS